MTTEQNTDNIATKPKLSRSEQARINGAKSKGPKTEAGKQRSAMNALTTAQYSKGNIAWLPVDNGILTTENRQQAFAHFDALRLQLQPKSICEIDLVKRLAFHNWQLKRLERVEAALLETHLCQIHAPLTQKMQENFDVNPADTQFLLSTFQSAANADEKTFRLITRQRRDHERAIREIMRRFKELQRDFPVPSPAIIPPDFFAEDFGLEYPKKDENQSTPESTPAASSSTESQSAQPDAEVEELTTESITPEESTTTEIESPETEFAGIEPEPKTTNTMQTQQLSETDLDETHKTAEPQPKAA